MSELTIGILGGGQLGSLLCLAAKKLNIKRAGRQGCPHRIPPN